MHQCMYALLDYRIECSHIFIAYSLSNSVKMNVIQLSKHRLYCRTNSKLKQVLHTQAVQYNDKKNYLIKIAITFSPFFPAVKIAINIYI